VVRASSSNASSSDDGGGRPLLAPLVRGGDIVGREPLDAARDRHARTRAELPSEALRLQAGGPAIDTIFLD
jgi:nicotinate phosphoribosyltransferase